ncbi:MAG: Hpt domain-containing protein [Pirellulales bacterium]|nr:Hpt domain-containing protein [Pirellulales bacterium]
MSAIGQHEPPGSVAAFDATMVLTRIGADMNLFAELVEMFIEDTPPLFAEIRSALGSADQSRLILAAHTLCGAIGNFTVAGPYELAKQLELLARANDLESARNSVDTLVRRTDELIASLKQCVQQALS